MSAKDPKVFLLHIRDSIESIEKYVKGLSFEDFVTAAQTQDALIRRLEIIGEAAKNLPEDFKKMHSDIPWKDIAGMRDVLIHEYFGVSLKTVWSVINDDLPKFKEQINNLLKN